MSFETEEIFIVYEVISAISDKIRRDHEREKERERERERERESMYVQRTYTEKIGEPGNEAKIKYPCYTMYTCIAFCLTFQPMARPSLASFPGRPSIPPKTR